MTVRKDHAGFTKVLKRVVNKDSGSEKSTETPKSKTKSLKKVK